MQPRIVVRASEAEGTVDSEKILKVIHHTSLTQQALQHTDRAAEAQLQQAGFWGSSQSDEGSEGICTAVRQLDTQCLQRRSRASQEQQAPWRAQRSAQMQRGKCMSCCDINSACVPYSDA